MSPADLVESRLREAMRAALRFNCNRSTDCPLRRDGDRLLCDPFGALVLLYDHKAGTGHDSESEAVYTHAAGLLGISVECVRIVVSGWGDPNGSWKDDWIEHVWKRVGARLAKEFRGEEELA